ncbi:MTOR associated protein, LST8 [Cyanidiococcus yangmingshanensis]|uniref:Target of rapamycin complex subunit LST8 n=1 Tax=Cyanidiococcus yangmingshanensis TaxID=2690220 RepID=A0A7J7IES7_9RHOD|nr:MTOR associated protein, LST8 [Cyanidiococcus yangmingshanensis]
MSKKVLLATGGYDHTVRFWEAASGICFRTVQFPESHINRMVFSPDKLFLAVAANPRIVIFDAVNNISSPVLAFDGHRSNVVSVGYEAFGSWLYSGSEDGTICTWDPRSGKRSHVFYNRVGVTGVVLHPYQRELISADSRGTVRTWDLIANRLNRELKPQDDVPINTMSMTPDGSLLAVCNHEGTCYVWEVTRPCSPFDADDEYADLERSRDTSPIPLTRSDSDLTDLQNWAKSPDRIRRAEPSRVAPGNPVDFCPLTTWKAHSRYVLQSMFSPNGKMLAMALDSGFIRLWNVQRQVGETWMQERMLGRHQKWVWDLVFSDNSEFLFSCSSDRRACLWDLSSGSVIRTYEGHKLAVTAIAVSVTTL